ncbi:energy-coupling factor ABC transporter ATP-binding protein [Sneathiella glossodoripedis]|uniref:energy-coupling factor ABC transporter ATP-binding protein n=1 Tax=Sneathiella glossodoripedis TaxID=418853 RepID=UPI00046F50DC|nr:ATP-binding cassette domain-containing protein [Sneathiella glossodoripedis]
MVSTLLPAECVGVTVKRQGRTILGPIDWTLEDECFTIVLGPNGAGKTTFLRLLHGLQQPRSGKVVWQKRGADLYCAQSFVFQTPIVMRRSVLENIRYPLSVRKVDREESYKQTRYWLERVGLADKSELDAASLSGGERQKMALARALITRPDIVFLDEPTTNLDGASTASLEAILKSAQQDGCKIVMATHDLSQARRLADDVVFLHKGKLVEHSSSQLFFDRPQSDLASAFTRGELLT